MAERVHTPGPWVAVVADCSKLPSIAEGIVVQAIGQPGYQPGDIRCVALVAPVDERRPDTRKAEDWADAHLLAAAPQLLESLLAVEWAGNEEDEFGDIPDACPNCGAFAGDAEIEGSGLHTPTCELRDALDSALGVKSPRAEVARG